MDKGSERFVRLPSAADIRRAVKLYLLHAYGPEPPAAAGKFVPPDEFDPAEWLMSDLTERDPADAPLESIRSFALRIGNSAYPHMKLRLSRPPRDSVFLFSVDSHDAFLHAEADSPDSQGLERLKQHNAGVAAAVNAAWDAAGLATEPKYLRKKIEQARGNEK